MELLLYSLFDLMVSASKIGRKMIFVSLSLLSRWWPSDKSLGPRGLLPLWSQVRAMWLLISWLLEAYMVVNFRVREISRGARKLARTLTLNKKRKRKRKHGALYNGQPAHSNESTI